MVCGRREKQLQWLRWFQPTWSLKDQSREFGSKRTKMEINYDAPVRPRSKTTNSGVRFSSTLFWSLRFSRAISLASHTWERFATGKMKVYGMIGGWFEVDGSIKDGWWKPRKATPVLKVVLFPIWGHEP